jgi:parallel beta-helix repeat protein
MNTRRIVKVCATSLAGLACVLLALLLLAAPFKSQAAPLASTRYVSATGSCGSAGPCYRTIQAAVDAASSGDKILVAAGTYAGVSTRAGLKQLVYLNKTVTIRGGYTTSNWGTSDPAAHPTVLNAQNQGRVFYIAGSIAPTIEGLHITGGNASGLGGDPWEPQGNPLDAGGGVYIITATAQLVKNQIYGNYAPNFGGGVYLNESSSMLRQNEIMNNSVVDWGGGLAIWYSNALIAENVIYSNNESGIWLYGDTPTFSRNIITGNTSSWGGGGVYFYYGGAIFDHNVIASNSASRNGGGVFLDTYSGAEFNGDVITDNVAPYGGGLHVSWHSAADLKNTVIANNQASQAGSGIYLEDYSDLKSWHTTLIRNAGGSASGIYITGTSGTAALTNTILVSHSTGISVRGTNTATVNGILWYNTPVTVALTFPATAVVRNQHTGNPAFAADGYRLTTDSAAIDAGVASGPATDIDDQPRPQGSGNDLGADESMPSAVVTSGGATLVYKDIQGNPTTVQFPPGAVTDTITVMYAPAASAVVPAGWAFAGHTFDLNAYQNNVPLPGYTFGNPVTVTLRYSDVDVLVMDETSLTLYYLSGNAWVDAATTCSPASTYDRHPAENWLSLPICHLSRFALFGSTRQTYLPIMLRSF